VRYKIPIEEYTHYKNEIFPDDVYTNVNYGFSNYMKTHFEKILEQKENALDHRAQSKI
jgi:hypothetical protein